MTQETLFAERILAPIGKAAPTLPDRKLSGFLAAKGSKYSNELMVVGRATNGWDACRFSLAMGCFVLTQEHQRSVVHLVSHRMYGSAASMLRLMFEAYIRGLWLAYCATANDLARFKNDRPVKDVHDMVKHVAGVHCGAQRFLDAKNKTWDALNSFTHCGPHQLKRYVSYMLSQTGQTYDEEEIVEILEYANTLALHSVLGMACVLGDMTLQKDCATRVTDYATSRERIRKIL